MLNIEKEILIKMYETMVRIRRFEERAGELVAKGEIKTPCHLYIGEEAVAAGVCQALERDDYIFGNHRSHGHYIAKGGDIKSLMAELFCKATGCSKGKGGSMHIIAPEIGLLGTPPIVAASIPIAVGTALASSIKNENKVSVSFFGDGATNEGVFYESLNFAALKKLPIIFVCENNLYSTHMPLAKILADTSIAKKASAFGLPGIQIDGNNAIEVYQAAKEAINLARNGGGPTLIECKTYRWRGHVGFSDDLDKGLRSKEELDYWMAKCPIKRLEEELIKDNLLSQEEKEEISQKIEKEVERAVQFAKESPYPEEAELSENIFKDV
ncbi:MAG: thiamine pyrophosphate-dependent dehydrogenase E1 component subunit alpha [bacterium]|nr:thiamine pyrophosphate-dependent dehydrogenase E1 component subunit alpha [bacterium]